MERISGDSCLYFLRISSTAMTNLSTDLTLDKWEYIYCDGLYPINEAVGIEIIKTLSAQGNGITTTSDFNASAKGTGMQSEKDKNKEAVIKAASEEVDVLFLV